MIHIYIDVLSHNFSVRRFFEKKTPEKPGLCFLFMSRVCSLSTQSQLQQVSPPVVVPVRHAKCLSARHYFSTNFGEGRGRRRRGKRTRPGCCLSHWPPLELIRRFSRFSGGTGTALPPFQALSPFQEGDAGGGSPPLFFYL